MTANPPIQIVSILQALFVTLLWSTSWLLIKVGLADIPALTFAGLRYVLAFLILLLYALGKDRLAALRGLTVQAWMRLLSLGLLFYALTQGAQFLGLVYLPAVTVSLLLTFTPVIVALVGTWLLSERPRPRQWIGIALTASGGLLYFYPVHLNPGQAFGLLVVAAGVLANAVSAVLGRHINRTGEITPLTVTVVSMGFGSAALLAGGLSTQGLPQLNLHNWGIIIWLAVVNTAFAFTLWNHTLRSLPAMQSSIINNTMLIQIAILAWLFLGERLSVQQVVGLVVAGLGTLIVQLARTRQLSS